MAGTASAANCFGPISGECNLSFTCASTLSMVSGSTGANSLAGSDRTRPSVKVSGVCSASCSSAVFAAFSEGQERRPCCRCA